MSLKSRLRQAAKYDHEECDGRFCELEEHLEMEAIERIAELEAENERLRYVEQKYEKLIRNTAPARLAESLDVKLIPLPDDEEIHDRVDEMIIAATKGEQ